MSRESTHSEYGQIKSLILKDSKSAFLNQEKIDKEWKALGYLGSPDFGGANFEYNTFQSIFKDYGVEIIFLPIDEFQSIDSIYVRDAAIVTDYGLILCNMGKMARKNEPAAIDAIAETRGIPILGKIEYPGTVEGGDVAWLDQNTLIVGHSYRTNSVGIRQLKELLGLYNVNIIEVNLPHYRGPEDVFHLMSIFSPVDKDLAVVHSPLMPIDFRNFLLDRSFHLLEVPESEFLSMGCNVLAVQPGLCLLVEGNPETQKQLEHHGYQVVTFPGKEICLKGGGGPTCLTRPLYREI